VTRFSIFSSSLDEDDLFFPYRRESCLLPSFLSGKAFYFPVREETVILMDDQKEGSFGDERCPYEMILIRRLSLFSTSF